MTEEKRSEANELISQKYALEKHLEIMKAAKEENSKLLIGWFYHKGDRLESVELKNDFFNAEDFYTLYILRLEKHLTEIIKKFELL